MTLLTEQLAYSQHKVEICQHQPSIGPSGIHFKLVRIFLFRCSCSIGTQHPKHAPDHSCKLILSFHLFFKNQKAKGRHLTPTVSLVRMCRVSRDTIEREKNNGFQDRAKFHIRLWNDIPTNYFYHQKMLSILICLHMFTSFSMFFAKIGVNRQNNIVTFLWLANNGSFSNCSSIQ